MTAPYDYFPPTQTEIATSKKTRNVKVRGHNRVIKKRTFCFICTFCGKESERSTWSPRCPMYGEICKDSNSSCDRQGK